MKRFNEEKFEGRIYAHINIENGKAYVGATSNLKPEYRWGKEGSAYKGDFRKAIDEYGWDNFDHIIYDEVYTTPEELNAAEVKYINLYDSIKNGYNTKNTGNFNYRDASENISKSSPKKRRVVMIELKTEEVKIFESHTDAGRWLHKNVAPHISPQLLSKKVFDIVTPYMKRKTVYGYTFVDFKKLMSYGK